MADDLVRLVLKREKEREASIVKGLNRFFSRIEKARGQVQRIAETVVTNLAKIATWVEQNHEKISATFEVLGKALEQYNLTIQESSRVLRKYKWFISPSLPPSFVFQAVKIGRKKGNQRKAINSIFVTYFSQGNYSNLMAMVNTWTTNPLFTPHKMKIIKDCVFALQNAKPGNNPSNVVLPALISQIEGTSNAYKKSKGFKALASKQKDRHKEWIAWFKSQTSSQFLLTPELIELSNYIFLDVLFQTAIPNQPLGRPFTFSRHKILHGEFLTYGRIDNTIRAFLILDFLAALK